MGTAQPESEMAMPVGLLRQWGLWWFECHERRLWVPERTKRQGGRIGCRIEVDSEINEVAIVTGCGYVMVVSRGIAKVERL